MTVGRNDPCPCGSGKKYKKCHGAEASEAAVAKPGALPFEIQQAMVAARDAYYKGDHVTALELSKELMIIEPPIADARYMAGTILFHAGQFQIAAALFEQAISLKDDAAQYWHMLTLAYSKLYRNEESLAAVIRAIELDPKNPEHHSLAGRILTLLGKVEQAVVCHQEAVRLAPKNIDELRQCCFALFENGQVKESEDMYRRFSALDPKSMYRVVYETLIPRAARSPEHIAELRAKLEHNIDGLMKEDMQFPLEKHIFSPNLFYLAYHGYDDKPLLEKLSTLYRKVMPGLSYVAPHCQPGSLRRAGKPRIGFISSFFFDHSVGRCYISLIDRLAASGEFEVIVVDSGSKHDALNETLRQRPNYTLLPLSLGDAQKAIAALELDILLYTDIGMDPTTYLLSHARLAPQQAVLAGHPNTTGVSTVDTFISIRDIEPEGAQTHYTEKLVTFQNAPVWYDAPPPVDRPVTRAEFNLPEKGSLYVCPMTQIKFHPEFDLLMARILEEDPDGWLVVFQPDSYPAVARTLKERFDKAFGKNNDRIIYMPWLSSQDFAAMISLADVVLDTIHFGGGTTSIIAFSQGAPIVTWPGPHMRGRGTLWLYTQMGITDLLAKNLDDYVRLALKTAHDREFREGIRRRILERNHVYCGDTHVDEEFAAFFRQVLAAPSKAA